MPFQDDPAIRPLMDQVDGGSPDAWMCLLNKFGILPHIPVPKNSEYCCKRITKTLEGMRLHQKQVHKYTPQVELGTLKDTVDKVIPESIIGNHGT